MNHVKHLVDCHGADALVLGGCTRVDFHTLVLVGGRVGRGEGEQDGKKTMRTRVLVNFSDWAIAPHCVFFTSVTETKQ